MKSSKIFITFILFILSMLLITNVRADSCTPGINGEIKSIEIDPDAYHFGVSFGIHEKILIWRNLQEPEGRTAFVLLMNSLNKPYYLRVNECHDSYIKGFDIYS
ncbi:hypothetical protein [Xenorhabdus szentirmaii]|uniref:Uncharacterized protein n=1 Tax=Xenorhabdus szentirmaii DSM 16338 TaxID=1427518 RepID=W1J5R8_9GAMM|nr:hypothetical protein [Xenorhabdus szentirmaii]PHM30400.1 hypothetical protein Xsze_04240 [Xenorhabdus szentirmaii DSM 16338]CDL85201.1 exported hypothetical protein [Xenorhabdus szentirmaii DSM 16338]